MCRPSVTTLTAEGERGGGERRGGERGGGRERKWKGVGEGNYYKAGSWPIIARDHQPSFVAL